MKISLGLILVGIALIILPTFTPEDLVTTLPLMAFFPQLAVSLFPVGVLLLIAGLLLMRLGV